MSLIQLQKDLRADNRLERIWLMAKIEFKLRYYENKLGLLWALIKPLVQMGIYYVAFALILRVSMENYALYLFIGLIVWAVFTESTTGMIVVLKTKKYLYEYSNMSKVEIYLSSLISIGIGFLFNLCVFIIALYVGGLHLGFQVFWLPVILINLFLISMGISMILSNVYLIIKDVQQVWGLILMFLFWVSPLLYSYEYIVKNLPFLSYVNPMAGVIINFRNVMMYNIAPDITLLVLNFVQGIALLLIGFFFLKKIGINASEIQ
jgi:ABC-type polysaccharide/polyol phosphate export permease